MSFKKLLKIFFDNFGDGTFDHVEIHFSCGHARTFCQTCDGFVKTKTYDEMIWILIL